MATIIPYLQEARGHVNGTLRTDPLRSVQAALRKRKRSRSPNSTT